jgi:hypothetical protein
MSQPGRPEITSARPLFSPKRNHTLVRKGHGRRLSDIVLLIALVALWAVVMAIFAGPIASLIVLWLDR